MMKYITTNSAKSNKKFHIGMIQICLTNHKIIMKLGQIAMC